MKYGRNNGKGNSNSTIGKAAVVAAIAAAISLGAQAPAIALADGWQPAQEQGAAGPDAAADEAGWDATASEDGFAADASALPGAADNASAGADQNGHGWWWRRVTPEEALDAAQGYFGVWDCDYWNFQVGRYRGIPAYRVEFDSDDCWRPSGGWQPGAGQQPEGCQQPQGGWQPWCGEAHYVAFVNYFTGSVICGYVDFE